MLAAREFLRAVRGRRSQSAFSRRLGYASNVVVKWEAGRRMPVAAEGLRACTRAGIDVTRAFRAFREEYAALIGALADADVAAWLSAQRAGRSIGSIAAQAGCSRYRVSRFLAGATRPRLPEFFAFVEALTGRLSELCAALVDIEQVPSLARTHRQVLASRQAAWTQPWSSAVLALLASGGIAPTRASPVSDSRACCRSRARWRGNACCCCGGRRARCARRSLRGALRARRRHAHQPGRCARLRRHFAQVGYARLDRAHDADLFSYNVFSVSRADYQKMRQLQLDFFQQMRALAAASEPSEVAGLMTLHLLQWDPEQEIHRQAGRREGGGVLIPAPHRRTAFPLLYVSLRRRARLHRLADDDMEFHVVVLAVRAA